MIILNNKILLLIGLFFLIGIVIPNVFPTVFFTYNEEDITNSSYRDLDYRDDKEIMIENNYISFVISSEKGASIEEMKYKNAVTMPELETQGAGMIGNGMFFIDVALVGEGTFVSLDDTKFSVETLNDNSDEIEIKLTAQADIIGPGCKIEKIITAGKNESGFTILRIFKNTGNNTITFQPGSRFEQQREYWRKNFRLNIGSSDCVQEIFTSNDRNKAPYNWSYENRSDIQWQMINQYGLSIITRTQSLQSPLNYSVHLPNKVGFPCNAQWLSGDITLEPGSSVSIETKVLICEGIGDVEDINNDRIAVSTYIQSSSDPGETISFTGFVVSPVAKDVEIVQQHYYEDHIPVTIASINVSLKPGEAREFRSELTPLENGLLFVRCVVMDGEKELSSGVSQVFIDNGSGGDENKLQQIRKCYMQKVPEYTYEGSWAEIGKQLVDDNRIDGSKIDSNYFDFYSKYFPYHAELLQGAAEELGIKFEQSNFESNTKDNFENYGENKQETGCIAMFFNGPDGPIVGFSKERNSNSLEGLELFKYNPEEGYSSILFNGDGGFNEVGLFIAATSINCDDETIEVGKELTEQLIKDGKYIAPGGLMLLSTCKTVDEAIKYIENEDAPLSSTSNMIIVDKYGSAAIVQSSGILHLIRKYDGAKEYLDPNAPVFLATNYPYLNEEELFNSVKHWDQQANGLIREWRVNQFIKDLNGNVTLKDVFWIMRSQNQPGDICQLLYDNVAHFYTGMSVIAHIKEGNLYISYGDPSIAHYEQYSVG